MGLPRRWRSVQDAAVVVLLLVVAWAAVYAAGGSRTALPHAFYIPVVIAATRFGLAGALPASVAAGILCGPLMPLNVQDGTSQELTNWVIRAAFFLAVGIVAAVVTDRLRRAVAREQEIAEERADLAAARTVVLQVVSHEIRTPLTIVKGALELFGRLGEAGPHARRLLPSVERAVARLEDLADVVIAAVDSEDGEHRPRPVVVADTLREAVESLSALQDVSRVTITPSGHEIVMTEPQQLRLVVRCLVENALKFSDATPVQVASHRQGDRVVIEVRDHGPGIPDDFTTGELEVIRQGDGSTTRAHGGMGLGLYATQRLVDRLGGELVLRRADGGGTTASVVLPARGAPEAGAGTPERRHGSPPGPASRVSEA